MLVIAASVVLMFSAAGVASADSPTTPDPAKQLLDSVQQATNQVTKAAQQPQTSSPSDTAASSASSSASPSSGPTSSGPSEPAAPDHASSHVLHGELLPGKLPTGVDGTADAGSSSSTINDDNTSTADASLLAVGGMDIYPAAHATSGGTNDASGPTAPVCEGTGNAVCPLEEEAHASETGTSSDSSSQTSAASICLVPPGELPLGLPETTSTDCPTGLGLGVLGSDSTMHRDKTTGETSGSTKSDVAELCLPGAPGTSCVGLIGSQGSADSDGTATRSSSIADFFGMSTPLTEPQSVPTAICSPSITAATPIDTTALGTVLSGLGLGTLPTLTTGICGDLNQGQTFVNNGVTSVTQTALSGNLLGLATLDAGHSEVRVHQVAGPASVSPPVAVPQSPVVAAPVVIPAVHHVKAAQVDVNGVLPNTGGIWSGWLAIALLALSAGSALAANDVRRGRRALA